jgi:hypothetical protein
MCPQQVPEPRGHGSRLVVISHDRIGRRDAHGPENAPDLLCGGPGVTAEGPAPPSARG